MTPTMEKTILKKIKKLEESDKKLKLLILSMVKQTKNDKNYSFNQLYGIIKDKISDKEIEGGLKKAKTEWLKELKEFE